ncbi:MAG: glycosyltransferase, partial [Polyangiaceae bacterium]
MRIAIVTTSWPGSEDDPSGHFVRADARQRAREGHTITVVAPDAGGAFGWPGAAERLRARPYLAFDAAAWIARGRSRLAHLDVDRVIAHWVVPCAWPIAMRSPARLEAISHGGDVRLLLGMPSPVRRRVVCAIARRASTWRFASEQLLSDLLASLDRATRAPLTLVASIQAPPIELPDVREDIALKRRDLVGRRVAVSAGRLVPGKRVDLAVRHLASGRDADILIVVGDGPE